MLQIYDLNYNIKFQSPLITVEAFASVYLVWPIVQLVNISRLIDVLEVLHECLPV